LNTSADVLEFEALRQLLRRYLSSEPGKRELEKLQPHSDRALLEEDLAEAAEAVEYLRLATRPQTGRGSAIRVDFNGLPDTETIVQKLRIEGAGLEPKEIFAIFALLDRAADAKSSLAAVAERFPRLGRRAQTIGEFRALLKDLEGKILPDGSVADHASVALARLRRDIERQKRSIQESLERFLRSHRDEVYCKRNSSPSATSASWCPSSPASGASSMASSMAPVPAAPPCSSSRLRLST